ncbi:MAG: glycosyltransferase family 39 protein [Planctomycetaceae bacterium]|nr:glycosyltransferase family 39 protein [Planctomycetaceae bacterium]
MLLILHSTLVMWLGWRMTPTQDEIAHLPAGLAIWRLGRTDLYSVNPPLVRGLAASPLLLMPHDEDWTPLTHNQLGPRREWAVGAAFIQANGRRSWWLFTLARWVCLPWTLLGGWIVWQWSRDVWSDAIALVPLALWCCSPNIIGYAALITPDIPAITALLLAAWQYRHWLDQPRWGRAVCAGLALGLAWLTKSQWLILLPIWLLLWLRQCWHSSDSSPRPAATQILFLLLIGWSVLCLGFGGRGVGQPLGELKFYSQQLSGDALTSGNRLQGTLPGNCPNPVPRDFLLGIDLQMRDFELGRPCYLLGTWREQGVWWFYLFGLAVKVPVGIWLLTACGLWSVLRSPDERRRVESFLPLLLPAIAVFVVASWQTSLHVYVRYVFCVLPVMYLFSASAWHWAMERKGRGLQVGLAALTLLAVGEGLAQSPHALSFFNIASGGPTRGARLLHDANVDWGQNLREVEEWLERYPARRPVTLAWPGLYPVAWVGLPIPTTPVNQLTPGWHLISSFNLHAAHGGYRLYRDLSPVGTVGANVFIYHVPPVSDATGGKSSSPSTHAD